MKEYALLCFFFPIRLIFFHFLQETKKRWPVVLSNTEFRNINHSHTSGIRLFEGKDNIYLH